MASHRLTNHASQDRWFIMAASLPGMIIAGELLGPAALAPLYLDLIDPYDYNDAMNRNAINKHMSNMNQGVNQIFTKMRPHVLTVLKASNPGRPEADYERGADFILSPYKLKVMAPGPLNDCYPDLTNPSNKREAGPPKPACDQFYREAYYKYIDDNLPTYEANSITNSSALNNFLNFGIANVLDQKLQKERNNYYVYGGLALAAVVVALLVLVGLYLVQKLRRV